MIGDKRKFIPVSHPILGAKEKQLVQECLDSSWVSSAGRFIPLFEEAFARYCGVPYGVAASSGTAALHLALLAMGVRPGDEVIVPGLTYVATANAVVYCGARPVFVDSEHETWNLDVRRVRECITPKTRGIIVVHLYGHPVDMDPILELARRRRLFVIEDAAQAHGAEYRGKRVGSLGELGVFSFFGNKIITTGEGGMVVTRDPDLRDRLRLLRGQGMDPGRRYWFPVVGYNYRMTNIQAALGLAQLEYIQERLEERRQVASWYYRELARLHDYLQLPVEREWARHVFWLFGIVLREKVALDRDHFMAALAEAGVETRPFFYPIHILPPHRDASARCPVAEAIAARGISLPTHSLLTEDEVRYIARQVEVLCRS